jgi:predicted GNAT family acetyltransferase
MHPLDNVIWEALTTRHSHLAEGQGTAWKFFKDVSMLAALSGLTDAAWDCLASLVGTGERVGLFLNSLPSSMPRLRLISSVSLLQMVRDKGEPAVAATNSLTFVSLGGGDVPEMIALTTLTKPGPFGPRTYEMGDYIGIREDGNLAAMAGERLKIPGYTEISAVCTHPSHLGRGYATAMILELMRRIRQRREIPFLHVRPENRRAVELYERLGFRTRIELQYTIVERQ